MKVYAYECVFVYSLEFRNIKKRKRTHDTGWQRVMREMRMKKNV